MGAGGPEWARQHWLLCCLAGVYSAVQLLNSSRSALSRCLQLNLQAESLRRRVNRLRVDVTIYRSSLAFMDDPRLVRWPAGAQGWLLQEEARVGGGARGLACWILLARLPAASKRTPPRCALLHHPP